VTRVAIYARVSTEDQDCEIQLTNLRGYAYRAGWPIAGEYVEKLSGKEGGRRPQLDQLMQDARMRRFDVVLVWKLDRFGRSTFDTLTNVRALEPYGVGILCPEMGIDTRQSSPTGKFMLTIFAAIAELERSYILDRTTDGQKAYRQAHAAGRIGKTRHSKSGKDLPVGRPRRVLDRVKVRELSKAGFSVREIAGKLGAGIGTIHRLLTPTP
jgi:putative DNA-invertase from lambdoid prophage Rac